ncbi:hypothetical protein ACFQ51_49195 [Streptomyces kaempferi]
MREKPLSKIGDELLRLRHGLSHTSEHRTPPAGFGIDRSLVSGFVAGELSQQDEAELARQMAGLLPFHWSQPNSYASITSQVTDHLGGQRELMTWLDRFPGVPRLVARLYVLMGLLDQYSENAAVVTALRELRERTPYPAGLKGYLVPETDDETLAASPSESRNFSVTWKRTGPSISPWPRRPVCGRSRRAPRRWIPRSVTWAS